jgi:imidazolonepropionase-like amidohydrolase
MGCTLVGARIWDGRSAGYLEGCDALVIDGGRIVALGDSAAVGRDGDTIDLGGCTVVPGLIDAHVHLCLDPDIRDPAAQSGLGRASLPRRTCCRDGAGYPFLELELRDRIGAVTTGPRLICAGRR